MSGDEHSAGWSVGDVASVAGVTVRTLHHYDEIGLLRPSGRSEAGYRLYSEDDLVRLQRVLGFRELGLPLDAIAAILDDPNADPVEQLRIQHALLGEQVARRQRQLAALEKTMEAHAMGITLTPAEMFEVFGEADPTEHAAEAEARWGGTDAYRESQRRTSGYGKADWLRARAEADAVTADFAAAYRSGAPAASEQAMDVAEAHRLSISRWFYACTPEIHRGLAQMYVADERFAAHYDRLADGLSTYVHDAIMANAER